MSRPACLVPSGLPWAAHGPATSAGVLVSTPVLELPLPSVSGDCPRMFHKFAVPPEQLARIGTARIVGIGEALHLEVGWDRSRPQRQLPNRRIAVIGAEGAIAVVAMEHQQLVRARVQRPARRN